MILSLSKAVYRSGSQFSNIETSHIAPELNPPVLTASIYTGALSVTDNDAGGAFELVPTFTDKWLYTPVNETKDIVLSVTDAVGTVNASLSVKATLPIQPMYGYDWSTPTNSKVITAKDNSPRFRRMLTRMGIWTFSYFNRTIMDVSVMKSFEFYHDIDTPFYLIDPEIEQQILLYLDSDVKVKTNGANNFEMTCIVKAYQLNPFVIPTFYS